MYGYDDMCLLAAGRVCGPEALHVTELVESRSLFSRPLDAPEEPDTEPGARFKKTDFVANYTSWKEELADADADMSDGEWAFSDSETESEGEHMDTVSQPDEEKFLVSLQQAQEFADEKLLQGSEDEENQPGQGYYSDYDDSYEPEYMENQQVMEEDEDSKWSKVGELHVLNSEEDNDPAELQDFSGNSNLYVISRQEFLRLFRALLNITLRLGELQISSVALSALHNATEQCLHRSLTEGSLHYQVAAILKEQEHVQSTSQLESELHMQREKVNELCETIAANKAAFKAKEIAMQQQIDQLMKQQQDVQMQTSPSLKKKSPGKRKATSKKTHTVRKGLSKSSNGSTSVVGALRSRGQNYSGTKKMKVNMV
ncbi:unnamed protein product [Phytophthora lilii]|uniref:Unnamed protein product n=1 Tax=Phytophthora lilii TaxID=2077276 RepID=A0A9W6YI89_9STRA|nr:unnamed protein product [Phytophthora lilii]